jgi:hypothetical protein
LLLVAWLTESAPTVAHTPNELLAIFRGHPPPVLSHVRPKSAAMIAVPAKAPKENAAEHQQPEPLPEGNHGPSEKRRQQPVPQMHHHFAEQKHE